MTTNYQERKESRINYYLDKAEQARHASTDHYKRAKQIGDMIPFGQPILVGHHSEKRHRRDIGRIGANMDKSIEQTNKAEYYENKAHAAQTNNSISSDDPDAIELLKEKLAKLEKHQVFMKDVNATWRKYDKTGNPEPLYKLGFTDSTIIEMKTSIERHWYKKPYAGFSLTNNNANIKRIKGRIIELERKAEQQPEERIINGVRLFVNPDDNRIQLFFDGIPAESIRSHLKSNGYRWSRYNGCWQAYIKRWNYDRAVQILENLSEGE